jgi:hypothetical protein
MRARGAAVAEGRRVRFWLSLLVVFHVTTIAAASGRADGLYFTEQIGLSRVGGELGHYVAGGVTAHIGAGYHLQGWAFEVHVNIDDLRGRGLFSGDSVELLSRGLTVRRLFPVSPAVRLYARGGVEEVEVEPSTWSEGRRADGYAGTGLDLGGGVVLSGRVPLVGFLFAPLFFTDIGPKVSAAAWLDVGDRLLSLEKPDASDLDGFTRSWLLGFSLGGRF